MVPKQRPFSGLNSGTTVGTLTVTVLGMVPKQKPFYTHPHLAQNLRGVGSMEPQYLVLKLNYNQSARHKHIVHLCKYDVPSKCRMSTWDGFQMLLHLTGMSTLQL